MDNIIYEKEHVREVVYEGILTIDERLTPRQQRRKIFNEMKKANIPVENEKEYEIGYEGVEDNNGISETQQTKFVVTREYNKQVPYRITREEVFQGTYILDGMKITPEEQRKQIFDLMRDEGFVIDNEDDYEIGFDGVKDDNGISETQVSHYTVMKIKKERLNEGEVNAIKIDRSGEIKNLYDEMVSLKKDVLETKDMDKVAELAEKVTEVTSKVDTIVEKRIKNYGTFEEQIKELEKQIKELEASLQKNVQDYEKSFEAIKEIMEEAPSEVRSDINKVIRKMESM